MSYEPGIEILNMGGLGALQPDWTLGLVIGLFILLAVTLNFVLYKPMLRVLIRREEQTQGVQEAVGGLEEETKELEESYEKKMAEARARAVEARSGIRKEGEQTAEEILAKARSEAMATTEEGRKKAQKMEEEARGELKSRAKALSMVVCQQVVGRKF